ncbi:MAG: hypothetical protein JO057_30380 [Chloroflexi bacterium]|nr:hypothetical protein [Chloroflexota bacterium]
MLRWLLDAWTAYAHRAGSYQTRVLLVLVYAIVLGPAALLGRAFGSRLLDLEAGHRSTWLVRTQETPTLDALRRQF